MVKSKEKVKAKCAACGAECEKKPKSEPKTVIEKNQIDFICKGCGAANLRNGTARVRVKKPKKEPVKPPKEPRVAPIKPPKKSKKEPAKPPADPLKPPIKEKKPGLSLLGWVTVLAASGLIGFLGLRVIAGRRSKPAAAPGPDKKAPLDPTKVIT
jgi:hypothetical protein